MMRPVLQRRPRRGADFVLPDVPMLDSPEWSDEESDTRSNRTPPQARAAVAAMHAANAPLGYSPGMLPPGVAPYFNAGPMQRIAMSPPPMNGGGRFPSPGLPRMSPALEQQQQQYAQPPTFFANGNGNTRPRPERRGGPPGNNTNQRASVEWRSRARADARRTETESGGGGQARRVSPSAASTEQPAADDDDFGEEEEVQERHSPSHAALGSFMAPDLAHRGHFAKGSLFQAHRREYDDDDALDEEDEEDYDYNDDLDHDSSLSSGTAERDFPGEGDSGDDAVSRREREAHGHHRRDDAESVIAPSYAAHPPPPQNAAGRTLAPRKASLFMVSAASSGTPHSNHHDDTSPSRRGQLPQPRRRSDTSAAPSVFNHLLLDRDSESPNNRHVPGTSNAYVGPQSVSLDHSVGPGAYTYDGRQLPPQQQPGLRGAAPYPSIGVSEQPSSSDHGVGGGAPGAAGGGHAAFANRHGTFLMSTEDANRPSPSSKQSPVSNVAVYPALTGAGTSRGLHNSPLPSVTSRAAAVAGSSGVGSAERESSAAQHRSSALHMSSQSHSLDGNRSTSSNRDFDLLRDNESVVPMPTVPKAGNRLSSLSDASGYESEEERYERMQQSRFFHSLNSRLTLRKTGDGEAPRTSNVFASLTWQGASVGAGGVNEDDVVHLASAGSGPTGVPRARGSISSTTSSSASPHADRLNFRSRIAPRVQAPTQLQLQQPYQVQPLSRFPPAYGAAAGTTVAGTAVRGGEGGAKTPPGQAPLAARRGLQGGAEGLAFSMEANMLRTAAAAAAVVTTTTLLGDGECDEYGLLNWAGSPSGPRRPSTVSVEDAQAAAATTKTTSSSSAGFGGARGPRGHALPPGSHRSAVMPLSLQPALISSTRRPVGAVTVVSPSEHGGYVYAHASASSASVASPSPPAATPPSSVAAPEYHSAPSLGACEIPLPPPVPRGPSSAPVLRTSISEERRLSSGEDAPQWSPNEDVFYYHGAGYSPMSGRQPSTLSIQSRGQRPPSFSAFRNNDYFLLNSFRSQSASHTADGDALSPVPPATLESNSNSSVAAHRNSARGGPTTAATPGNPQKRLSGQAEGDMREMPRLRHATATTATAAGHDTAVVVVARSPRVPSTVHSVISVDAIRGLADYGFPEEPSSGGIDAYYGMDDEVDGYSYLPPPRVMEAVTARHAPPHDAGRPSDGPPRLLETVAPAASGGGNHDAGVPPHQRRPQRLSTSSAEDYATYYYSHPQYRRHTSRETLRSAPSPKDAKSGKPQLVEKAAEDSASRGPRARGASTSQAVAHTKQHYTPRVAKSASQTVVPPSQRLETLPAFTALHSSEHSAPRDRHAYAK